MVSTYYRFHSSSFLIALTCLDGLKLGVSKLKDSMELSFLGYRHNQTHRSKKIWFINGVDNVN